jgi:hypothetical protein
VDADAHMRLWPESCGKAEQWRAGSRRRSCAATKGTDGTQGVLKGYSIGTGAQEADVGAVQQPRVLMVLKGYSRGTQSVLARRNQTKELCSNQL